MGIVMGLGIELFSNMHEALDSISSTEKKGYRVLTGTY